MLTNEAFNALLKTLEEPPAHALFILCTTDPQKLPLTIISRCLKLEFKRPETTELSKKLTLIAQKEKISLGIDAAKAISDAAGGAFRDAEVMLERVIAELRENIANSTSEAIVKVLGVGSREATSRFLTLILENKTSEAVVWLDNYIKTGGDVKTLNSSLLEQIRFILLIKLGLGEQLVKKDVTLATYDLLQTHAGIIDQAKLNVLFEIFTQSLENLKISPIMSLPLELAVAQLSPLSTQPPVAKSIPEPVVAKEIKAVGKVTKEEKKTEEKKVEDTVVVSREVLVETVDTSAVPVVKEDNQIQEIMEKWGEITKLVKSINNTLFAVLSSCEVKGFEGTILTLSLPYAFHKERLEESKNRRLVEKIIFDVVGSNVKIKAVVDERKKRNMKPNDLKNVEPVSDKDLIEGALDIFNSSLEN